VDGGSNGAISGSNKSKMAAAAILEGRRHLGKISNGHIYATGRPIHFTFRFKIYTFYAVVSSVA